MSAERGLPTCWILFHPKRDALYRLKCRNIQVFCIIPEHCIPAINSDIKVRAIDRLREAIEHLENGLPKVPQAFRGIVNQPQAPAEDRGVVTFRQQLDQELEPACHVAKCATSTPKRMPPSAGFATVLLVCLGGFELDVVPSGSGTEDSFYLVVVALR